MHFFTTLFAPFSGPFAPLRAPMAAGFVVAMLAITGCQTVPMKETVPVTTQAPEPQPAREPEPIPEPTPEPPPALVAPAPVVVLPDFRSDATTPKAYRRDAAEHIYRTYPTRIYKGRLPPLIASVAVFELHIDSLGEVVKVNWVRGPWHRPDIMADIEQLARGAAPYPAPVAMAGVVYTDVWLYDQTGLFQLATLTEGQRSK